MMEVKKVRSEIIIGQAGCIASLQDISLTKPFKIILTQQMEEAYSSYLWISGRVLAEYLFYQFNESQNETKNETQNRTQDQNKNEQQIDHQNAFFSPIEKKRDLRGLELGAGVGLAGLAGLQLGFSSMCFTDISDVALEVCRENAALNTLAARATFQPLLWGAPIMFTKENSPQSSSAESGRDSNLRPSDQELVVLDPLGHFANLTHIFGADVFYEQTDFEPLVFSVFQLLSQNPGCVFVTAYQERSETHYSELAYLFRKWGLVCLEEDLDFLSPEFQTEVMRGTVIRIFVVKLRACLE